MLNAQAWREIYSILEFTLSDSDLYNFAIHLEDNPKGEIYMCSSYKYFNVIIIRVRVPRVKFRSQKDRAVYFSLGKDLSLSSPRPPLSFSLCAGTLISSFSFFMNNGRALCAVFAAATAVAASGQFPWYSLGCFSPSTVTHANGIARCIRNNAMRETVTDPAACFKARVWCKNDESR